MQTNKHITNLFYNNVKNSTSISNWARARARARARVSSKVV